MRAGRKNLDIANFARPTFNKPAQKFLIPNLILEKLDG